MKSHTCPHNAYMQICLHVYVLSSLVLRVKIRKSQKLNPWINTGLIAPRLSSLSLVVFRPNTCCKYNSLVWILSFILEVYSRQWIILQYINTGKYCFILQILILRLFTEVLLISILMLSIQNLILKYWYFQYFTVSVFYVLNQ